MKKIRHILFFLLSFCFVPSAKSIETYIEIFTKLKPYTILPEGKATKFIGLGALEYFNFVAHGAYYLSAFGQFAPTTLEDLSAIYTRWINDPATLPAGVSLESVVKGLNRTKAFAEIIKSLASKAGVTVKTVTVFVDGLPQAMANGSSSFANIGISTRWIDHPLDDVKLLKHFEAALAHEFAHARLSHIPKRVILSYLTSLILTIHLAEKTFNNKSKEERYKAALINSFLTWAIKPRIDKLLSRLQEFQADAYGASWTSAQQMAEALEFLKLSFGSSVHGDTIKWLKNGSKESHPAMDLRIKRLKDADIEHRSVWADWRCWLTW